MTVIDLTEERMASVALAQYLPKEPMRSQLIAEKYGLDFDQAARDLLEPLLDKNDFDAFQRVDSSEIYSLVYNKPAFCDFLSWKIEDLSPEMFSHLIACIPELYSRYKSKILNAAIFGGKIRDIQRFTSRLRISPEVVHEHFSNKHLYIKLSSDERGNLAWMIETLFAGQEEKPVFDPEALRCLRLVALKSRLSHAFADSSFSRIFKGITKKEKMALIREVADWLVSQDRFADAASFADQYGLVKPREKAANLAYARCISHNQYFEAASLALKYGLNDSENAAQKALDNWVEGNIGEDGHTPKVRIGSKHITFVWALKFGLKLGEDVIDFTECLPEELLAVDCLESARKRANHLLGGYGDFRQTRENYFSLGNPYFTDEETIEAVAHALVYRYQYCPYGITMEEAFADGTLLRAYSRKEFLSQYLMTMIKAYSSSKEEIQNFTAKVLIPRGIILDFDLTELAQQTLSLAFEQNHWDDFRRIAKEWFHNDVYLKILEVDNSKIE